MRGLRVPFLLARSGLFRATWCFGADRRNDALRRRKDSRSAAHPQSVYRFSAGRVEPGSGSFAAGSCKPIAGMVRRDNCPGHN